MTLKWSSRSRRRGGGGLGGRVKAVCFLSPYRDTQTQGCLLTPHKNQLQGQMRGNVFLLDAVFFLFHLVGI